MDDAPIQGNGAAPGGEAAAPSVASVFREGVYPYTGPDAEGRI